jgi:hypothetical protein
MAVTADPPEREFLMFVSNSILFLPHCSCGTAKESKTLGKTVFFAALCDVSGKGIAVSMIVSPVWGFPRAHTLSRGLSGLIADMNVSISTFHMGKYPAGFCMIYDSAKK